MLDYSKDAESIRHWAMIWLALNRARDQSGVTSLAGDLAHWAELGRNALLAERKGSYLSWNPCRLIVGSAARLALRSGRELSRLLGRSQTLLDPLGDPLTIRFELHRWLAADREEAYSDWLAWIFNELGSGKLVGKLLFGSSIPGPLLETESSCDTDREVWANEGHEGRTGRLDCVLRFGRQAVVVIEVKLGGAEAADTVKQSGYFKWLEDQDA